MSASPVRGLATFLLVCGVLLAPQASRASGVDAMARLLGR